MGVVIRQSIKGTALTYVGAAVGFVTQFFIVTKFLDPEIIGLTKVFYEVGAFCAGLALLGACSSGMRFFPYFKDPSKQNNGFFFWYLCIPLVGTVLVSALYLLFKTPIIEFFSKSSPLFRDFYYYALPLIPVLAFWLALESYSNINMRIAVPKGIREVCLRVFLLADYLLYAFEVLDIRGLIIALLLTYALCLAIISVYISRTSCVSLRHDASFLTPELKSKFFRYSGFLILAALTSSLMNQLDIFMLSSVKGLYSAGIYTIAFYMANVIEMPSRSITAISTPIAAEALKNGDNEKAGDLYKTVSIHQLIISGILLLIIWVNIDNIFAIIPNGDKFSEGKYVVLFLGLSKVILTTLNFGGVLIQFSKYYYWTLFITILLTALTIGTNLFFIPRLGVTGAALATFIAVFLSSSWQQYIVHRKIHCTPFSVNTLKVLGVLIILYALNLLIPSLSGISPWLDIFVRTVLLGSAAAAALYALKVSAEINRFIDKLIKRK